jgi:pentose-5-phosphate-3-epimerase
MKQFLIAPSILSADFARLGEDTAKACGWRRCRPFRRYG